ncbi:MAG: sporulation protein YqfD, partial [Oscillospiraceae bacterium]|nr:sporulation protein YqfD [Oscillospiraceae bacterium]
MGYVDFEAFGTDIEKFITLLAKDGIEIISQKKKKYMFYGRIYAKDYLKIRKNVKKCGLKIKIIKKHGLKFLAKKNKNKIGFIAGSAFIICFVLFMNMFVWEINVLGNRNVKTDEILKSASEMGLITGTLAKDHFVQDIEWFILRKYPELSSVEINIQGSIANIKLNETREKAEMVSDDDIPTNIIASKYGVIRRIDVFDGQKIAETGEAVMKGDLLVSAVYEDRHNKLTLKHARANVIAETDYSLTAEFPLEQKIYSKDKIIKKTYKISFLGKDFIIGNYKNIYDLPFEETKKDFSFFGIKIPINVIITRYFSVKEDTITYTFE